MDVAATVWSVVGILAVASVIAWLYVESVYHDRDADVRELTRLVQRDRRIAFAASLVVIDVILYLYQALPWDWFVSVIGVAVALMLLGPIDDAIAWFRLRREARERHDEPEPSTLLEDDALWREEDR